MLYDCCVGTTVQRLLVWRRSKAHDRKLQHCPMTWRRRYNVGLVTVVLGFLLSNGHLVALVVSAVLLFPSQLLERSLSANEQQEMPDQPQQEVLREILQEKLDVAERAGDEGAVKKIRAFCPELASKDRGDGGVDLWISLTKQMCSSCSNSSCNWSRQRYDTSTRQLNKKKERLRLGSPFPKFADNSRTQRTSQRPKCWTRNLWTSRTMK